MSIYLISATIRPFLPVRLEFSPSVLLGPYLILFFAAFGAATLLPLQSEAVLVSLLALGEHPAWMLVAVASTGNVLGSWVELVAGAVYRALAPQILVSGRRGQTGTGSAGPLHRYGRWSLLLSWTPIIGDPLTLVAGIMREPLWASC